MPATPHTLRTVDAWYITPLREGGSLPAIVEASDGFLYMLKFRGAGQDCKSPDRGADRKQAGTATGLSRTRSGAGTGEAAFGRTEPDEEIQDLLKFSEGLNLALHYLRRHQLRPAVNRVDEATASKIVWMDVC